MGHAVSNRGSKFAQAGRAKWPRGEDVCDAIAMSKPAHATPRKTSAALRAVAAALRQNPSPGALAKRTLEIAVEALGATAGSVLLHEPEQRRLVFTHVIGATPEIEAALQGTSVPDSRGLSGHVLRSGRSVIVADVARSKQHNKTVDAKTTFATRNLVAVPVRAPGSATRPIGVVEVLNKRRGAFTQADRTLLELLASQAAAAIEMSRLQRAAALSSLVHRLGDVGHDVKNLLTPVETGTRTIARVLGDALDALEVLRRSLPDELGEVLEVTVAPLRNDVQALHTIVLEAVADVKDRVREIAEAVKGIASEPAFEPTDLRALVASVLRVLYPVAEPSGVALDFAGVPAAPPWPLLMLDRRRMFNALYNLVHNAVAATPSGGTVRVLAVHEVLASGSQRLRLVVVDDGAGIPPPVLCMLFTDETVSTKVGGTGLGTRIVQQVARAHGGDVRVESVEGQGAKFTLDLPWCPAPQP